MTQNMQDLIMANLDNSRAVIADRERRIVALRRKVNKNVCAILDAQGGERERLAGERVKLLQELDLLQAELREARRREDMALQALQASGAAILA